MFNFDILSKYSKSVYDTGSVEIQIILITFKLDNINIHLKKNPKDNSCKRSLIMLLSKRSKLIKFLKRKNKNLYYNLLNDLKIKY